MELPPGWAGGAYFSIPCLSIMSTSAVGTCMRRLIKASGIPAMRTRISARFREAFVMFVELIRRPHFCRERAQISGRPPRLLQQGSCRACL